MPGLQQSANMNSARLIGSSLKHSRVRVCVNFIKRFFVDAVMVHLSGGQE